MSDPSSHFVLSTGFSANVTIPLVGTVLSTVLVNHFVAPVSADTVAALTAGLGTIVLGSVFNGTLLYFGVPHATLTGDGVPHAYTVTRSTMLVPAPCICRLNVAAPVDPWVRRDVLQVARRVQQLHGNSDLVWVSVHSSHRLNCNRRGLRNTR
jgi:hypothetical protein